MSRRAMRPASRGAQARWSWTSIATALHVEVCFLRENLADKVTTPKGTATTANNAAATRRPTGRYSSPPACACFFGSSGGTGESANAIIVTSTAGIQFNASSHRDREQRHDDVRSTAETAPAARGRRKEERIAQIGMQAEAEHRQHDARLGDQQDEFAHGVVRRIPGSDLAMGPRRTGDEPVPTVLSFTDGLEFEKIAGLQPDLIIGMYSASTQEDDDTLTQDRPHNRATQGQHHRLGRVVAGGHHDGGPGGRQARRGRTTRFRGRRPHRAGRRATTRSLQGRPASSRRPTKASTSTAHRTRAGCCCRSFGFEMPEGLDAVTGQEFGANLSQERTDLLDVDALVWLLNNHDVDSQKIEANPLHTSLNVSTQDRDIFVARDKEKAYYGATSFISAPSLPMSRRPRAPAGGGRRRRPSHPGPDGHRADQRALTTWRPQAGPHRAQ